MGQFFASYIARLESSGERVAVSLIAYVVVAILLLVALGALTYAVATAIALSYGPVAAALSVAAMALVAAAAVLGWLSYRRRRWQREVLLRQALQPELAAVAIKALPTALQASPLGTLAAVAAAAYVVAKSAQK